MHRSVMLLEIEGLYKTSTIHLSLSSDILVVAFSKALVAAICILGTKVILNAWKLEVSFHISSW